MTAIASIPGDLPFMYAETVLLLTTHLNRSRKDVSFSVSEWLHPNRMKVKDFRSEFPSQGFSENKYQVNKVCRTNECHNVIRTPTNNRGAFRKQDVWQRSKRLHNEERYQEKRKDTILAHNRSI